MESLRRLGASAIFYESPSLSPVSAADTVGPTALAPERSSDSAFLPDAAQHSTESIFSSRVVYIELGHSIGVSTVTVVTSSRSVRKLNDSCWLIDWILRFVINRPFEGIAL